MGNRTLKGHRRNQWGSDNAESDFLIDPEIPGSEQNTGKADTAKHDDKVSPSKLWATAKKKKIFKGNFACFCTAFNKNPELAEDAVLQEKEFFINDNGEIEFVELLNEPLNAEGIVAGGFGEGKIGPPVKITPSPTTPVAAVEAKTNYKPIIIGTLVVVGVAVGVTLYLRYKNKTNE